MKTLLRKIFTFIYFLLGILEPAVYDIGSRDNKHSISAKIVKFISAGVFVFSLIWGLIAIREIINYLEFGKFLIAFFVIGMLISIFVIYFTTKPIPSLKGNKDFVFFTLLGFTLITPLFVDYLNNNALGISGNKVVYELTKKSTKSESDMFSWIYLKNSRTEIKVNVSKEIFHSLKLRDKVEVRFRKGLLDFEFIDLVQRTNNIAYR
jgi:hypothetical protein